MSDQKKTEDLSEDELDEIIAEMSKEEDEAAETPAPAPAPIALVKNKTAPAKKSGGQALTMELTGAINLKLNFATGDRSIELVCSEDELLCRMADGTEFRIPTGSAKKRNAA